MHEKLAEGYGKGPLAWFVFLFGGGFTIAAIASGNYFFESITTFIYGLVFTYLCVFKEKHGTPGRPRAFLSTLQVIAFILWVYLLIAHGMKEPSGIQYRFNR